MKNIKHLTKTLLILIVGSLLVLILMFAYSGKEVENSNLIIDNSIKGVHLSSYDLDDKEVIDEVEQIANVNDKVKYLVELADQMALNLVDDLYEFGGTEAYQTHLKALALSSFFNKEKDKEERLYTDFESVFIIKSVYRQLLEISNNEEIDDKIVTDFYNSSLNHFRSLVFVELLDDGKKELIDQLLSFTVGNSLYIIEKQLPDRIEQYADTAVMVKLYSSNNDPNPTHSME